MAGVLIETNREHQTMGQVIFGSAFQLNHQTAITIQKTGNIGIIDFSWLSHDIVLIDLLSSSELYHGNKDCKLPGYQRTATIKIPPLLAELASCITA
jgi:hypothetical protein